MIISFSGLIGSGKDTAAEYLTKQYGFTKLSFASTLKDVVSIVFGWDRQMLEGKTQVARAQREQVDAWWAYKLNIPHLSPRWVLQHFGTEVFREHFHQDIWVTCLENKLRANTNVVVSDTRFINELTMLDNHQATLIHIKRGEDPSWWNTAQMYMKDISCLKQMTQSGVHPSEWRWAPWTFDKIIHNDSSLENLYMELDKLV